MEIDRTRVVAMMRRVGLHDAIPDALASLPEKIDTDRDGQRLAELGISRERLLELLGSSP